MNWNHGCHIYFPSKTTLTDSKGYLYDEEGFDDVKLHHIKQIKQQERSLRLQILI